MRFDDESYYKAYDHNYRVAYEEGFGYCGEGGNQAPALDRLAGLLEKTGLAGHGTKVLDIGCGDGTEGIFLASLGYCYTGIDVSPAAIERARQRTAADGVSADFRVGDAMNLSGFAMGEFPLVLDSYCLQCLVLDRHRQAYFRSVKRVMKDEGVLLLRGTTDHTAFEGPVNSFEQFCERSGTCTAGVALQKCVHGTWHEVSGKRQYLFGRAQTMAAYQKEFSDNGFRIVHQEVYKSKGAAHAEGVFILKKAEQTQEKRSANKPMQATL
ncbi:MAG: class I SAM-dependent methyltransferase [Planctomycetes bacterium]|nr:class I SAM-dependent methyltransferase [Planctomycetota bacterium]